VEAFGNNLLVAEEAGATDGYRALDGGVLLALDGVGYHSSKEIFCKHCLHKRGGRSDSEVRERGGAA
jgi:hypothetical protein